MRSRLTTLLLTGSCLALAHDPVTTKLTWSQEISRIVSKRCGSCHRDGGAAMPLVTYEQARPWAKAIRDEVLNRRMPTWGAVKGFGDFRNDASLSQEEITRIAQWVEGGAPEGDPVFLPPPFKPGAAEPVPAGIRLRQIRGTRPTKLVGIHPLADVEEAKIKAVLPDGTIEPLIWLREYKNRWNTTFVFREPLTLPARTKIVSEPPVPVEFIATRR